MQFCQSFYPTFLQGVVEMGLNSGIFMLFLGAVCVVSYALPRKIRYVWLLVCSYAFYLYSPVGFTKNLPALGFMLAATVISYLCALLIHASHRPLVRKISLGVSLLVTLGFLITSKYLNFILDTVNNFSFANFSPVDIILPLGISYYTLQTVSYCIDVYRRKIKPEKNPFVYALYVSFFPGIVTGPINRAEKMLAQYKNPAKFHYNSVAGGLFRILWGLFKKTVLADTIGIITSAIFSNTVEATGPQLLAAALLFSYQLYTDFGGSVDIAIGAAQMLGFTFTENFNRPFAAKTFSDLWRRWHISLTSFFRDYVYIPLGGSRVSPLRWAFNTMAVFVISGLWHGASMGYLIWGFMNGLIMLAGKFLQQPKDKLASAVPVYSNRYVRGFFQRIFTYLLFTACLLFFAASLYNFPLQNWFRGLLQNWQNILPSFLSLFEKYKLPLVNIGVLAAGVLLVEFIELFAVSPTSTISSWVRRQKFYLRWPLYYGLLAAFLLFGAFGKSPFIYQQY